MGSFPGHYCKANIAVEQVTDILLFPSGSKSYVYMIFGPTVCYSTLNKCGGGGDSVAKSCPTL